MPKALIDVSRYDNTPFSTWKERHGLWGVIIKIGGNERVVGGRYADPYFKSHWNDAVNNKIYKGVYYYTDVTTVAEAIKDADHCVSLLGGRQLDLGIYMDVEDQRQFGLSKRALTDVIKAFCDRIEEHGFKAGLYTGGSAWNNNMYPEELRKYVTWIASWQKSWPTYVGEIELWQQGTKRLSDGAVYYDDVSGCQDFDWASDKFVKEIEEGGTMPTKSRLTYALAAAEVMDHFIDHDEAHGYSQPNRDGTSEVETITLSDGTEVSFQSGDRDCSRLVQTCNVVIGALPRGLHVWTGNERETLVANGFIEVPLDSVQRGDVLWREGHTEMYMGSGIEGGARRSETHGIDGRTGDQDGGEIARSTYIKSHWTSAYRCNKTRPDEGTAIDNVPTGDTPTQETTMKPIFLKFDGDATELLFNPWAGTLRAIANADEKKAVIDIYAKAGVTIDSTAINFGTADAPWGARANDALSRGANFKTFERFEKHPSTRAVIREELNNFKPDVDSLASLVVKRILEATKK